MKILLISANEVRHKYLRKKISQFKNLEIGLCIVEKNSTRQFYDVISSGKYTDIEKKHFQDRFSSEKKYFGNFVNKTKEIKNLIEVDRNEINENLSLRKKIIDTKPDLAISYGCSIIKEPLLSIFKNRFINIHLGLSPYYRGSATNFWPFVLNELQFVGITYMNIDSGVDTGPILHQFRAKMKTTDTIHDVGNKLIMDMVDKLEKIIINHKKIKPINQNIKLTKRVFKKSDFNKNSLEKLTSNLKKGMIKNYLNKKDEIDKLYPLIQSI
jgi:folate-dependent phosphoribosylglycinamide formyltransferase PurN